VTHFDINKQYSTMGKKIRIGVISDIHANATALSAVLSDAERCSVDSIICLGDVATLGPSPREVLKILRDLHCTCIRGNHEEALFRPENAADYDIKGNLDSTLYWCIDRLQPEDMSFLDQFVPSMKLQLNNKKSMFCYHGTPQSTIESIYQNTTDEQIDHMFCDDKSTTIAVGGHTHVQMLKQYGDLLIINPGSVGCAFRMPSFTPPTPSLLPVSEYAIVESAGEKIIVEFRRIEFDIKEYLSILSASDLPLKDWWME